MNRKEKREMKKEIEIFSDVVNIIKQYFPSLIKKLDELTDVRHQSYVEYTMSAITVSRLLGLLCGIKSMRETTEKFNTEETIKNISNLIEEEYSIYYHYVLEAKLVVGDIVISIDTEFVENEDENVDKQDCEIRAFYRMAERIKKEYPKLAIIISGDALYACEPVIRTCINNKWEYILRLKEERQKLLVEEIKGLEKAEEVKEIRYWNNIKYGEVKFEKQANVIKYYEKKKEKVTEFMWLTSFKITEKNKEKMVYYGRQRWKIENEGFNMQKNGTFDIEHVYSNNYNAMKAHYFFIQFAHTIRQLLEKGIKYVKELKMSIKEVSVTITQTLTHKIANLTKHNKMQLRFELKLIIQ